MLLHVQDLTVTFQSSSRDVVAVKGATFSLPHKSTLGLVGESGCGKTVTAHALAGLLPKGRCRLGGKVFLQGEDLLQKSPKEWRALRGKGLSMIFQNPMTSLNPLMTVGRQIMEVMERHEGLRRRQARHHTIELLERVGIQQACKRVDDYPHEFSGGMQQRVMIAICMACKPKLLIADEPTTALDAAIQNQILGLLKNLQAELGTSILLITHDFNVVKKICDAIAVMQNGRIVEEAPCRELLQSPQHPYTKALLAATPKKPVRVL